MGCHDIYCFLCGNPCYSMNDYSIDHFMNDVEYNEKFKKVYNTDKNIFKKIKQLIKDTRWMLKCTFLNANNEIIHNCEEIACNIRFQSKDNVIYIHDITGRFTKYDLNYGVFIHTDCWKFIKKKYNIELNYSYLPITSSKHIDKIFDFINYGDIEKYWSQYFDFFNIIFDKKQYLCMSPLKKDKNLKLIIKNFNKLKIRLDKNRKSPIVSASFYENNDYKIGNDNNIWKKSQGKWIFYSKTTIVNETMKRSQLNFKKNKYMGERSKVPKFIKSIEMKKNNIINVKFISPLI